MSVFSPALLKRRVFSFLKRVNRKVFFDESQVVYNGRSYKSYWDDFYRNDHRSFLSTRILKAQVRRAFFRDGFRPDEFCLHGFENKNKKEKIHYLSQKKKDEILISYYGSEWLRIIGILRDKYVFYSYLKDFYKRDVFYLKCLDDRGPFLAFCKLHNHIFAKLNKGSCGNGARKLFVGNEEQANMFFDELVVAGEWIIEELIIQDSAISAFNSSSINTVRFPSFKHNGVVKCAFPCIRFGRAGSIVDNAALGGLIVSIDEKTGELFPNAYDERGNVFAIHPDSKLPFRGFRIPQWEDLVALVKKAHLALPSNQVYVAFDLALSDKGWCIVEGNWGDLFLQQLSLKRGLRNEFVSLLMGEIDSI